MSTANEIPAAGTAKKVYEQRDGSVILFKNNKGVAETDHHFEGNGKTLDGKVVQIRLWREMSNKSGKDFYKGYYAESREQLDALSAPKDDSHDNYIILFYNDTFTPETKRPMYTGKWKDGANTLQLSLWNKIGAKGEFYSGTIEHRQEATGTENI